jgi:hypothetical protein
MPRRMSSDTTSGYKSSCLCPLKNLPSQPGFGPPTPGLPDHLLTSRLTAVDGYDNALDTAKLP